MDKKFFFYALFSVFAVAVLSLAPLGENSSHCGLPWDKLVHFFMYLVLTVTVLRALTRTKIRRVYRISFILPALFGVLMESAQYFLPYRSFEFCDMLCNIAGCAAGCFFYRLCHRGKFGVSGFAQRF